MIKYNKLYYASLQLHDPKKLNFRKKNMNMSIAKHYSGGLTREQFLFYGIRTVASLVSENVSRDEIYIRVAQVTSTLRKETPQAEPNQIKHYIT